MEKFIINPKFFKATCENAKFHFRFIFLIQNIFFSIIKNLMFIIFYNLIFMHSTILENT